MCQNSVKGFLMKLNDGTEIEFIGKPEWREDFWCAIKIIQQDGKQWGITFDEESYKEFMDHLMILQTSDIKDEQQTGSPRKCVQCGKTHDMIVENTMTGDRIEELPKCRHCMLFSSIRKLERPETPPSLKEWEDGVIAEWGGSARCMTSDGRNVNMAEELNRLEKELLDG